MKPASQQTSPIQKKCNNCRHSIPSLEGYFCGKLGEKTVANTEYCAHFELVPPDYTLYRRS